MRSFFSQLYKYRARVDMAPLENFLIEVLAEMFRRMPIDLRISFALSLVPFAEQATLSKILRSSRTVELTSQVSIPVANSSKRPDLVLYADNRPLLVIEAKVGAVLQDHGTPLDGSKSSEFPLTRHQLQTYSEWIKAENSNHETWLGAITFLTAFTTPPTDFSEGQYEGAISAIRSWRNIGDWIVNNVATDREETTHCALASELRLFLKEKNLMTKYMSARDLAGASIFAPSASSLHLTFVEVMKAIGKHAEKLKGSRQIKAEFWSEGNVYWGWFHFAESIKRRQSKPYVAVGICFEVAEPWIADSAKLPQNEPFFFLACADDWAEEAPRNLSDSHPSALDINGRR